MAQKIGQRTLRLEHPPGVCGFAAAVGRKEGEGPLGRSFDRVHPDALMGQSSWEKAESFLQREALDLALEKAGLTGGQLDAVLAGDLLDQCIASTFGLRGTGIPTLGLYGACSTMAEGIGIGSLLLEAGGMTHTAAVTSSHFCTAERQYRTPLEYGGQRPPTAQWTVTGAGAVLLGESESPPWVRHISFGAIEDLGVKDAANMGAAMAPAAAAALRQFFEDTCTGPGCYDAIVTGDLGQVGSTLLRQLLAAEGGYDLGSRYTDCGLLIYDRAAQDVHAGGSGCGCCASVLCGHLLPALREGRLHDLLFVATGALLSPTSSQQGETIPGIAHLIHFSDRKTGAPGRRGADGTAL